MRTRKGFTLIELLIVVAIIAILAAIAVPNFLEAQVRSKVSRTMADMRSVKVALEAYRVDANKYPTGRSCNNILQAGYPEGPIKNRLTLITTPVAYITGLPDDVFNSQLASLPEPCDKPSYIYLLKQYHAPIGIWNLGATFENQPTWVLWPRGLSPEWTMLSQGPAGTVEGATTFITAIPYDPTNGTVSHGQIVTWGPG
ncbi:MAG: prepilin-type N-terminal cleavage/methylation domain-containing protein [Candidatus Sumerlaeia bacterium]|nr:prepilin-type N-terminal cleavage/methylation domain-containing protein [Candidatus Sumerlaeia bacterium]